MTRKAQHADPSPPGADGRKDPHEEGRTVSFGARDVPPEEKAGLVRGVFDAVASKYDFMNDVMSLGVHRIWKELAANRLNPQPGERIVDVAGGTGDLARAFRRQMQAKALRRAAKQGAARGGDPFGAPPVTPEVTPDGAGMQSVDKLGQRDAALQAGPPSDRRTDGRTDRRTDGRADRREPGETERKTNETRRMDDARSAHGRPLSPDWGEILVLDINEAMLNAGRARGEDGLCWATGDAQALPLPDGWADAYTIGFGIRNVTDMDLALAEARRVLKPGGRFLCLEFSRPRPGPLDAIYRLWSDEAMPRLGGALAGDEDSYRYLVESIRRFPDQTSFARRIERAGFKRVRYTNLSGGIAAIHQGWVF